ncbi:MAG: DUF4157 domain-containing protein [Leptolyngbya sp.]|nr:DUF4157 domain-containing protein [Leptolyngbya sp.]
MAKYTAADRQTKPSTWQVAAASPGDPQHQTSFKVLSAPPLQGVGPGWQGNPLETNLMRSYASQTATTTTATPQHNNSEVGGPVSPDIEQRIESSRQQGHPLSDVVRPSMEQAFGADFSSVRIHTDTESDQLNQAVQAKAFTTGQDIYFRSGEYAPGSRDGQELLAHELTHVVQQTRLFENQVQRECGVDEDCHTPAGSVTSESREEAEAIASFLDRVSISELGAEARQQIEQFMGSRRARRFFATRPDSGRTFEQDIATRYLDHLRHMSGVPRIRQQLIAISELPHPERIPVLVALLMSTRESSDRVYSGAGIPDSFSTSGLDHLFTQQTLMRELGVLNEVFAATPELAAAMRDGRSLIGEEDSGSTNEIHPAQVGGDEVLLAFAGHAGVSAVRFRQTALAAGFSADEIDQLPTLARNFWLALSAAAAGGNWPDYRDIQMVARRDGYLYGAQTLLEYMYLQGLPLASVTNIYSFEYQVTPEDRRNLRGSRARTRGGTPVRDLRVIHRTVNFRNQRTRSASYLAATATAVEQSQQQQQDASEAEEATIMEAGSSSSETGADDTQDLGVAQ